VFGCSWLDWKYPAASQEFICTVTNVPQMFVVEPSQKAVGQSQMYHSIGLSKRNYLYNHKCTTNIKSVQQHHLKRNHNMNCFYQNHSIWFKIIQVLLQRIVMFTREALEGRSHFLLQLKPKKWLIRLIRWSCLQRGRTKHALYFSRN
jgi:hypothetical protein